MPGILPIRGIFGVAYDAREIPLDLALEHYRRSFVGSEELRPTLHAPGITAYASWVQPSHGGWIASRWPAVLWDRQDERFLDTEWDSPGTPSIRLGGILSGRLIPAADDCLIATVPDGELSLFSSCTGASRFYFVEDGPFLLFCDQLVRFAMAQTAEIDRRGLGEILRFGANDAKRTLLTSIRQLPYAHRLQQRPGRSLTSAAYRSFAPVPDRSLDTETCLRLARDEIATSIAAAPRRGELLLSGGVDSALIALLGRETSPFAGAWFLRMRSRDPEERWARSAAEIAGLPLRALDLDLAVSDIEETIRSYTQPTLDFSILPTFRIGRAAMASGDSDLIFDGTGGDAWFGFSSLRYARLWRLLSYSQRWAQPIASALHGGLITYDGRPGTRLLKVLSRSSRISASGMSHACANPLYRQLFNIKTEEWLQIEKERSAAISRLTEGADLESPDEMLVVDATMIAISQYAAKSGQWRLASRCQTYYPYFSPNVVELGLRLPSSLRLMNDQPKWLLKQLVGRSPLGEAFAFREKVGFQPPLQRLLKEPHSLNSVLQILARESEFDSVLRPFAKRLPRRLLRDGVTLGPSGRNALWSLLMMQIWMQHLRAGTLHLD